MESEKNYFKQLSKKPIPKFNFHHADNQKENILKNKAKVQKKQSWVIDKKYKTNYLNTTKNIIFKKMKLDKPLIYLRFQK